VLFEYNLVPASPFGIYLALDMKKVWQGRVGKKVPLQLEMVPFKRGVSIAFFVSLATILLILILYRQLPPQVPLFYGLAEGEEQLVPWYGLIIPSLASLAIICLNILVANLLTDDFLRKTLVLSGLVATSFSTITTIKIILLVGSF
jgi:hypothetical protein